MSSGICFGWTSVYNIVIPGQDNGDFVAPAASKTLAFYYFDNIDYDKERWNLDMKIKLCNFYVF